MKSNPLLTGTLAVLLQHQQLNNERSAKQAVIALNALIESGEIELDLATQSQEVVDYLEMRLMSAAN